MLFGFLFFGRLVCCELTALYFQLQPQIWHFEHKGFLLIWTLSVVCIRVSYERFLLQGIYSGFQRATAWGTPAELPEEDHDSDFGSPPLSL